jgi:hypothetical protein
MGIKEEEEDGGVEKKAGSRRLDFVDWMAATDDHAQNELASDYPRSDNEQYVANNRGSCQTSRHPTTPLFPPREKKTGAGIRNRKSLGCRSSTVAFAGLKFIQKSRANHSQKRHTQATRLDHPTNSALETALADIQDSADSSWGPNLFEKSPRQLPPQSSENLLRQLRLPLSCSQTAFYSVVTSTTISTISTSAFSQLRTVGKTLFSLAPHPVQYSHHLRNHQQLTIAIDCFLPFALRIPYCKIELVCLCLRFQLFIGFRNEHGLFLHKVNSRSE